MAHRIREFEPGAELRIEAFGEPLPAREGETVAAALLAAGRSVFSRSVKYHRPRGPFCLAGRCSNCLVRVNGVPNRYACLTRVAPGMRVEAQNVIGTASLDALGAIDFLFPRGLDHHEMFAGVPVVEKAVAGVARHLAGLGKLPDSVAPPQPPAESREVDLAVVGAGPAGLALARAAVEAGLRVELVDENAEPGGHLACLAPAGLDRANAIAEVVAARGRLTLSTLAIGAYRSAKGPFLALRTTSADQRVSQVHARAFALCTGGSETAPIFPGNDLPGVFGARGLLKLVRRHGVVPGERAVVLAEHAEGLELALGLQSAGVKIAAVIDPTGKLEHPSLAVVAGRIDRAHGRTQISRVRVAQTRGAMRTLSCDILAVSAPVAPSFELARQLGLRATFTANLGFTLGASDDGSTALPHVFLAGEVNGRLGAEACIAQGAAAAKAIVKHLESEAAR